MLLIDEIDRADDDFEAFLLELLADASVTIPELGTITATHPPIIVLTSNRTRDLHDAVKRRCLYRWIDYPTPEREVEIVRRRVKGASETLAVQVADAVSRMRDSDVQKPPGIAEAIDWLAALSVLGIEQPGRRGRGPHPRVGAEVRRGPGGDSRGRPRAARAAAVAEKRAFGVETIDLDLPPLAGTLGRRLRAAGVPVTPERSAAFARALTLTRPDSRRRLYWTARSVFVTDRSQARAFDEVFRSIFGDGEAVAAPRSRGRRDAAAERCHPRTSRGRRERGLSPPGEGEDGRRGRRSAGDGERRGGAGRARASTRSSRTSSPSSTG